MLGNFREMLTLRADYAAGSHALTRDDYRFSSAAAGVLPAFGTGVEAWRAALVGADRRCARQGGRCTYRDRSGPTESFIEIVWWVDHHLLHHEAGIAVPCAISTAHGRGKASHRERCTNAGDPIKER
ncbi:MAG: hypothetical protein ABI903_16255 [Actinomycetota bacterium]